MARNLLLRASNGDFENGTQGSSSKLQNAVNDSQPEITDTCKKVMISGANNSRR